MLVLLLALTAQGFPDPFTQKLRAADQGAPGSTLSVAGVGDVDGDGFEDVLIGVSALDGVGAAFLYRGDATGVDNGTKQRLDPLVAVPGGHFGFAVHGIGDLDEDGWADVAVGAPGAGVVTVWFGSPSGLVSPVEIPAEGPASELGTALASADLDGDGVTDLVIGAPGAGQVAWVRGSSLLAGAPVVELVFATQGRPGVALAVVDLDADSWPDVASCSEDDPPQVVFGSPTGPDPAELATLPQDQPESIATCVAIGVLDASGDGQPDLALGDGRGTLTLWRGGPGGPTLDQAVTVGGTDFGSAIVGADFDDDGLDNLLVGAPALGAGSAFLSDGTFSFVEFQVAAGMPADRFGSAVSRADVNGDGLVDGLVAAPGADDNGEDSGSVYLYLGVCADTDQDGSCDRDDCAPEDPSRHPAAPERCNQTDDDCNGVSDDDPIDAEVWYRDGDGDGATDPASAVRACEAPEGYRPPSAVLDCDDTDPSVQVDCGRTADPEEDCGCGSTSSTPLPAAALLALLGLRLRRRA